MTDEEPLLLRTEKGFTAAWKGVQLYPTADPGEYARRKARVASLSPRTLVFVPSVGLGYGLAELLDRLPESSAVLCVEAHQQIMALAAATGVPRDPRLVVLRTESEETVIQALRGLGTGLFRRVVEVPLCAGYRLAPGLYKKLRGALEAEIHGYWRNRLTLIALGSLQVRNVLANLALLPEARDFSDLSTGLPVVVAGAGPSLDHSIQDIRAVRDRVFLLAVDTALPRLAAESLSPDLVIALEAQVVNLEDFLIPRDGSTLLACDLSSHPSVPRLFKDRVFFFSSEFAALGIFQRLRESRLFPCAFPALGSVGVAAVHAALRLTAGDVFVTGLDFSFPGGLTHARGTPRHIDGLSGSDRLGPIGSDAFRAIVNREPVTVSDKAGRPVVTDSILRSYRDGLARFLGQSSDRVRDIGVTGLDLGAPQSTAVEMRDRAGSVSPSAARHSGLSAPTFSRSDVGAFISSEKAELDRGKVLLRKAVETGTASPECLAFLQEADYTYVHFPDAPSARHPDRGFLARAGVAVRYYRERWERLGSLL